jgi:hypothetical protein
MPDSKTAMNFVYLIYCIYIKLVMRVILSTITQSYYSLGYTQLSGLVYLLNV